MSRSEHHPRFEQRRPCCKWCQSTSKLVNAEDLGMIICADCDDKRKIKPEVLARMFGCGTDNGVV